MLCKKSTMLDSPLQVCMFLAPRHVSRKYEVIQRYTIQLDLPFNVFCFQIFISKIYIFYYICQDVSGIVSVTPVTAWAAKVVGRKMILVSPCREIPQPSIGKINILSLSLPSCRSVCYGSCFLAAL